MSTSAFRGGALAGGSRPAGSTVTGGPAARERQSARVDDGESWAATARAPVADPRELADLDPFDLMDVESIRLDIFFATLPDDGWAKSSRCVGWTVRDLLAHLATVETYSRACLDDTVDQLLAEAQDAGAEDMDGFNEWGVRSHHGLSPQALYERWRADNGDVRRRMRWRGVNGTVSTSGGWYPAGLQGFYLAVEYAAHADDMGAPVGVDERAGRTLWRARFTRFALAESGSPVTVLEGSGGNWVRYRGDETMLSDEELVEAGIGRLPQSHEMPPGLREALVCLA